MSIPAASPTNELLQKVQAALASCSMRYNEYNQFEGDWVADFNEKKVHEALVDINALLGLPPPKPFR